MSTQKVISGNPIRNNGATVVNAGNVSSTGPVTKVVNIKDLGSVNSQFGGKIVQKTGSVSSSGDPTGVTKARAAGTFAYSPEKAGHRNFIIRGAGSTSAGMINGSGTNLLNTTGSEFAGIVRGKRNTVTGTRRVGVDKFTYPDYSIPNGTLRPGIVRDPNKGEYYSFTSTTDNEADAADKVLTANRSIPGELTYRTGAPLPTTTNILPRDEHE
jgi:hypothetical protein